MSKTQVQEVHSTSFTLIRQRNSLRAIRQLAINTHLFFLSQFCSIALHMP